jgi:hypothetical protein
MPPINVNQHAQAVALQASADAFAQAVIDTQISSNASAVWHINHLHFDLSPGAVAAWAAGVDLWLKWSLTTESKNYVLGAEEDDWLEGYSIAIPATAAAATAVLVPCHFDFDTDIIVAAPALYLQLDSNATAQINQLSMRVEYTPIRVTELELLRLRV